MLQFYFLSILLNAITGLILFVTGKESSGMAAERTLPAIMMDETFRLVLGILTGVTGFFKLLTAVRGDVPVIGDLLPALAGLVGGFSLLYEYYQARAAIDTETLHPFLKKIIASRYYVGIACLSVAGCHFLFPTVLFL
jgi:uncharacterized membrane-anchored protein